ncbi:hypothetical protein AMTRI_Chr05g68920 [Amborella trichopoda]|uniref:PPM-type phosphatase domain-containing protein n=1 Tax=Amborella trichopoda TaxID=13333 RepID=U5CZH3_AMBTC|nr:probable protein phosphatase 2C 12 [Amborella trichopoda]ERN15400.1 hypothetical protein AMTR_s00036p00202740 [Amborella trichopoda]|eukprot:XP_006853933.1 probable protein phosphatase 2C 12 [Amborella trichopoda]
MGACVSCAAHETHLISEASYDEEGHDIFVKGGLVCNGFNSFASFYSQQGRKGCNQDAFILCQGYGEGDGLFCGVFDGHGQYGHLVSKRVREWLPSMLLRQRDGLMNGFSQGFEAWDEACIRGFKALDKNLKLSNDLDCSFSGTTAVTIIKQGGYLVVANLGDSRAVLGTISEDGTLTAIQLTTDQKPNVPQEAERIRQCNGRVFALKEEPKIQRVWLPDEDSPGLAMARAFGDFQLKDFGLSAVPQVTHHKLTSKDQFVILASDGVWDALSNTEVVSIVSSAETKETAAKDVVESAIQAWQHKFPSSRVDDCSVVCLFVQEKEGSEYTTTTYEV